MRRKPAALVLILVLFVVGLVVWNDKSAKQAAPDGTVLLLSGLKIGRTNVYTHGTAPSRILGHLVPSNGITLFGLKLQRPNIVIMPAPDGCEMLTAELRLVAAASPREHALVSPPFYRKYRLLISGDDDEVAFVKEFDGFKRHPDGFFSLVWAWSFPRDSRLLHFRLEERQKPDSRDWHEVATLVAKNPKPARIEPWKPEQSPRFKLRDGLEVQVGELTVGHEPTHPTDIWEYTASLPVRVTSNGQTTTNWGIAGGRVQDASGNYDSFTFGKVITNDWMVYRLFRVLDPSKTWRFQVSFAQDSNFPATNLFSFTVPWPLSGAVQTNLGGHPCRIAFVNTDMLSVELPDKPGPTRLTFVKALDDQGVNLDNRSGSWGQHSFWKSLNLSKPAQIHATIAIHENHEAEFTLQPRYQRPAKPPGQKPMQPSDK